MRLTLPSWLIPGTWLENARVAAGLGWASGMELLLFSFEGEDRDLFLRELPGLSALAGPGFGYTVHLPDPLLPAHEELVRLTRSLASSWVLHPPAAAGAKDLEAWVRLVEGWRRAYGDDFLLEYTGERDFEAALAALDRAAAPMPLCADTGRLLVEKKNIASWIAQRSNSLREIHLHGFDGTRDHRPLSGGEEWLAELAPVLAGFGGQVELEVFSLEGAMVSRAALGRVLGRAYGCSMGSES